jgi:large subunit ribosomal protein L32
LTQTGISAILVKLISIPEEVKMGACPKNRVSKLRGRKRRTHYKAAPVALAKCAQCFETKRPHHVCPSCGYYGKKVKVLDVEKD